ncbi:MAG: type IV secretion system DNA-binding domain-containing protein, partial [Candidatus Obscuribacterales bacterium]|nr:type IV secretion system DNA-binding domain-containing protein [Candidatus Obscuribacterales bacterium]
SLRFFGPSGLLNIWAKKEYIPSQFKTQHFKMVKEMGKPVSTGGIPLGKREEWGLHQFWLPRYLCMPATLREKNPHLFILGAGATGKTRLMASMIAQDIKSGDRAVVLVDSDGGLADLILDWIASQPDGKALSKRVIVVDPTDGGKSLCYNPLEFPENEDLQNAASAIAFGFKAAYTEPPGSQSQWNQQTANILRNSAVLLMANGRTLTDLPVLLSDNDFRDVMLQHVEQVKHQRAEYITLIDAWANYKRLARTDQWITWIEPILNRVQPMLSDPRLRAILTKAKSELDLRQMISEKQILIVKIPQGQLDKNGNLLGSLMVAGIKQAALSLSSKSRKKHPCSLYLDEFESFIEKETFDTITSETRKLQIAFCGASKSLQTMPEDFRNKIIINVGMMAVFALAKKDADMIGPQMFRVDGRKVKHQTIQNVFNKVNSSPQFELIMDEEKLNIDRVVGQEKRTYFCYRVGSVAGVFRLKAPDFADVDPTQVNKALLTNMRTNRQEEEDEEEDQEEDETDDDDEYETDTRP